MALQRSPSTVPPGPLSLERHQGAWAAPRSTTPNGVFLKPRPPAPGPRFPFPASGSCSPDANGEFSTGRRARAASKYAALGDAGPARCRRGYRPHGPRRARKTTPGDPRNAAKPRRYWLVPENPPALQAALFRSPAARRTPDAPTLQLRAEARRPLPPPAAPDPSTRRRAPPNPGGLPPAAAGQVPRTHDGDGAAARREAGRKRPPFRGFAGRRGGFFARGFDLRRFLEGGSR